MNFEIDQLISMNFRCATVFDQFKRNAQFTDGSCENCCGAVDLGSNTVSKPGKLAIDDGGGTFAN